MITNIVNYAIIDSIEQAEGVNYSIKRSERGGRNSHKQRFLTKNIPFPYKTTEKTQKIISQKISQLENDIKKKSKKSLVEKKKVVLLQSQNGRNEALEKR